MVKQITKSSVQFPMCRQTMSQRLVSNSKYDKGKITKHIIRASKDTFFQQMNKFITITFSLAEYLVFIFR